jgi:beta-glucosidase
MLIKYILLSIFLVFHANQLFLSQQPTQQSWYQWIKSFLVPSDNKESKFQKAIQQATAGGKPLDLQSFYKQKEEAESFTNPQKAAEKFRNAIQEAAQKSPIMACFKDHPERFLFGASSSSYQYEGGLDDNNANAIFYASKGLTPAGKAIDFWNRYAEDIVQMKNELNINAFRISIAWDRVQPKKGQWDELAIATYQKIIKTLRDHQIEPIVVLNHYTIPQWFAALDGFEKNSNITYFVTFAKKMYTALHTDVTYWSTFNAIEGYAFKGYYTLDGPPGLPHKKSLFITEKVMYNMLNAHTQVYEAIKGKHGLYEKYKKNNSHIPNPQIGIQKNIVLFDPFESKTTGVCERKGSQFICNFSSLLNNTMFFRYIRFYSPLDWIGLNIYSNVFMLYAEKKSETDDERKTENFNYRDYPEGIYRAVKIISDNIARPLNIPIFITENGIATKNDPAGDEKRTRFLRRALYTIRKLVEEGYNIIGYTPWASHDNYEWPSKEQPNPYDRPYGLFHVDFNDQKLPRTLKKGAYYYRDFIKEYLSVGEKA